MAMDSDTHTVSTPSNGNVDLLRRFPTEVRLMIFEELLVVSPTTVFRGASKFGKLDKKEFNQEVSVPWQILLTCHQYHQEAAPIMYGKNRIVFCTGIGGEPGEFWRFPIHRRYMAHITDLGIYLRADSPKKEAAIRIGHFIKALARHAKNLSNLVVLISSDRFYEGVCPWDIVLCNHPVARALIDVVEMGAFNHLKIRLHDGACLFPGFAQFLDHLFHDGVTEGRSITFSRSCTCPVPCPHYRGAECIICDWPRRDKKNKPIESLTGPMEVESCTGHMMDMQIDLAEAGLLALPGYMSDYEGEENEDTDVDEDENEEDKVHPYKDLPEHFQMLEILTYDDEENRLAFHSSLHVSLFKPFRANRPERLPESLSNLRRKYRGEVESPHVWSFRQTKLDEFYSTIVYEEYLARL